MSRRDEPSVKPHRGRLLDARLHLLDRQLLDAEGTRSASSTIWNWTASNRTVPSTRMRRRRR
jgi:hypothetical protein